MTVGQLFKHCVDRLSPSLGASEAKSAAKVIFEDVRGMNQTDLVLYSYRELEDFTVKHIDEIVDKIVDGMPVQYAVGCTVFCGLKFTVNPSVLIPRPETEWLVDWICDDYKNKSDLNILDCGTGSGCIAISLARGLAFANITAIDNSAKALDVARHNASELGVKIKFDLQDILSLKSGKEPAYDIIVSNPPYIADFEKSSIDKRVKNYEPSAALFVPDNDPLIFYRAIAQYALTALHPGGRLYFEINPLFVNELSNMLSEKGYSDVTIFRDYLGHNRYIISTQNSHV